MSKKREAPVVALTEQEVRLVAVLAGADVRTARRWLNGEDVRGAMLKERLEQARAKVERDRSAGGSPA